MHFICYNIVGGHTAVLEVVSGTDWVCATGEEQVRGFKIAMDQRPEIPAGDTTLVQSLKIGVYCRSCSLQLRVLRTHALKFLLPGTHKDNVDVSKCAENAQVDFLTTHTVS